MKGILRILTAILTILVVTLFTQVGNLKTELENLKKSKNTSSNQSHQDEEHEEFELAVYMNRLQLFANKLYFAGKAENKTLFDFYLHEMEETMEEVIDEKLIDDGVDISENMAGFGYKQIKLFKTKNDEQGFVDFENNYANLVNSCNGCHMVSKHPYIVIKNPETVTLDNQDFSKQ